MTNRLGTDRTTPTVALLALATIAAVGLTLACSDRGGTTLYAESGCPKCHGTDGRGGPQGPALADLDDHWDVDRLVLYLQAPDRVRTSSERLQELSERYPGGMPGAPSVDPNEIEALARYVLGEWG